MMTDFLAALLASLCLLLGATLMLLAAIGALRMPDLPMRMHATTKAGALGSGLIMLAVAIHFADTAVTARVVAIIAFIMLTAPVAAHVIARAGYVVGVTLWERILQDDLKGKYDADRRILRSPDEYADTEPHAGPGSHPDSAVNSQPDPHTDSGLPTAHPASPRDPG